MKSTGKVFSPDAKDVTLTINGKQISAANLSYAPNTYLWEVHIDDSVVVTVVKSGESGGTSFTEPDYYPIIRRTRTLRPLPHPPRPPPAATRATPPPRPRTRPRCR